MRFAAALLLVLTISLPAFAQTVRVGAQRVNGNGTRAATPPYTLVDLSHPASADGNIINASVRWSGTGCTNAYKIKILRPDGANALNSYTLVGERGGFTAQPGTYNAPISPALAIKKGDLIALTVLVSPATCGSPAWAADPQSVTMLLTGDVTTGTFNGVYARGQVTLVRATDSSNVLEGVIPAVGSLAGGSGSFFRTSLQIANPTANTESGTLVYHPAGVPASASDQIFPYTLAPGATVSYADFVNFIGKSGLGTLDVISSIGAPPLVTARVYNDSGAAGTAGFTEDLIPVDDALHTSDVATILTPSDPANFRVNVGIRTLAQPATITFTFGTRGSVTQNFTANTFVQPTLQSLSGLTPVADELITVNVVIGDAVIYASTTDNRTNDSSIRFARRE
jgi:hypothetical protein